LALIGLTIGLAEAISLGLAELLTENSRQQVLRDRLWQGLQSLDGVILNGHPNQR
jgi:cysteine desulfurase